MPEGIDLVVRDTGPGVDADFLPHVFERFRQGVGGTTRAHGGLGLGLAIVRHLVELHGGTVRAENNTPAPGATFHVLLPARPVQERGMAQARTLGDADRLEAGRAAPYLDGLSVLVVDDDVNARELLTVVLENVGARVRAASSAEDALMELESWSPGVLLSDIEMPGQDGYMLIEKVRRHPTLRETKLVAIALTAHARPEDRRRALEAGFQWHLAKPVDPGELISVIATLVSQTVLVDASI